MSKINLRDSLLAALSKLPGTREFHVHVLVTSPRKTNTLYPFARPRPKAYVQDVLVLCSEQANPDAPRIIVTAIEVSVYNIPATSSALLYVSKVDSTGHSNGKAPTAALVRALLTYYADPATRPVPADHLWIQLFARAQGQYLFPNSADFPGKRPLNDVKLCAWWKRLFSQVAADLEARAKNEPQDIGSKAKVKTFYVLPGYNELEAEDTIRIASGSAPPLAAPVAWHYGHPYSQNADFPIPCPLDSPEKVTNLGNYIPWFEDDPKSRFLDEIAYITADDGIKSPARKRSKTASSHGDALPTVSAGAEEKTTKEKEKKDEKPMGELGKVTADEFWERMSFRQECVAGAVTGFFTLICSCPLPREVRSMSPLAPQPGQVSSQLIKRIMASLTTGVEFSTLERSIRATETLESAIKGLCEGISAVPTSGNSSIKPTGVRKNTAERGQGGESSSSGPSLLVPPSTPPRNKTALPDISPNPFPEPTASLETYQSYIYGSIAVNNPVPTLSTDVASGSSKKAPHVTVLTVRKKKKRTD